MLEPGLRRLPIHAQPSGDCLIELTLMCVVLPKLRR